MEFKQIEKKIIFKMMNREKNAAFLEDVVHRNRLDLAAVYHLVPESGDIAGEPEPVTAVMMEKWEISEDEIFEIALENLRAGMDISMKNILASMIEMMSVEDDENDLMRMLKEDLGELEFEEDEEEQMFVVSDKNRSNGAAVLMMDDVLAELADRLGSDVIIIPASVRELVFARDKDQFDQDALKRSIAEVNTGIIDESDYLSNNAYRYIRETGKLTII